MKIEHNSQMQIYRSPFGAVCCGDTVNLCLGISRGGLPNSVRVHCIFDGEEISYNMAYIFKIGDGCFYRASIRIPQRVGLLWYYFEVISENGKKYYGNNSEMLGGLGEEYDEIPEKCFQITVYDKNYKTPDWFKDSIVYQIFPDRFYNGNENGKFLTDRCDIIKREWGEMPFYKSEQFGGEYKSNDFFGGNLKGIEKKLQYLAELGIGTIYLNPIFKAYSNHKYDTGNYMMIDEGFGTYEDFVSLCKTAEKYGIKIILDGVFNHTGSNSIYFNKNNEYDSVGAYQSTKSEYYDWFNFTSWPEEYESWWGMMTLPSVNERSESFANYIIKDDDSVTKHWIRAGASGWRLDVVDELPDFFVKELRKSVKSVNSEAVIIGEVWEDASNKVSYGETREYFLGYELDSVMNYPLRNALIDLAKRNIDAVEFNKRIMSLKENYPKPAYYSLLNILSTHDVERLITAVGNVPDKVNLTKDMMANMKLTGTDYEDAVKRVKQVVMFQMLMPGVPCIYYGDEVGMQGYNDPFCRQCYPWGYTDEDLKLWYSLAIGIRKSYKAYISGEFEAIYMVNYGYGFIRMLGDDKHVICANFGENTEWFRIDLARFNIHEIDNEIFEEYYYSEDGIYYVEMNPGDIKVFKCLS